jgi:hypothetical protein
VNSSGGELPAEAPPIPPLSQKWNFSDTFDIPIPASRMPPDSDLLGWPKPSLEDNSVAPSSSAAAPRSDSLLGITQELLDLDVSLLSFCNPFSAKRWERCWRLCPLLLQYRLRVAATIPTRPTARRDLRRDSGFNEQTQTDKHLFCFIFHVFFLHLFSLYPFSRALVYRQGNVPSSLSPQVIAGDPVEPAPIQPSRGPTILPSWIY